MNYMYKLFGTALAVLFSVSVSSQIPFTKVETKNMMRKVADWQIAHPNTGHEHDDVSWTHAVLYAGMADWAELSEKEDGYDFYYRWLLRIGSRNQYQLGSWMYHADFIAVAQVYLDLYNKYGQERMIWHTLARTDWVIRHPAKGNLELDYSRIESLDRWS